MKTELEVVGENIRKVRRSLDLSQQALAEMCDLHRTYICDIERGARNLSLCSLSKLARGLGTTVSELTRNVESACPEALEVKDGSAPQLSASLDGQRVLCPIDAENVDSANFAANPLLESACPGAIRE